MMRVTASFARSAIPRWRGQGVDNSMDNRTKIKDGNIELLNF
jgi:hypothetical protein